MPELPASTASPTRSIRRLAGMTLDGLGRLGIFLCLVCQATNLQAADAYRPDDDDQVLERLPRVLLAGADELATLRSQLASDANNPQIASTVASRYLAMGNQAGDPRFFGYARAALSPWWEAESPPADVLRLRAKLKEKDHLYDEALADLETLLTKTPEDTQAWVEKANILRVQGKYEEALAACESLAKIDGPERALVCRLPIEAVTGKAKSAYEELNQLLPVAKQRFPSAVGWVITMQAKLAVALGLDQDAEQHFRAGLESNPADYYLLREYGDFLLDQDRASEALSLLREHIDNDNGILLRAAIAAKQSGESELSSRWSDRLGSRFEEIRLRGNEPHGRFEARYLLELKNNPQHGLTIALENWAKQKEFRDNRNVLEAALAAQDRAAAQPVLDFLAKHGTEHVVLQKLIEQLESLR